MFTKETQKLHAALRMIKAYADDAAVLTGVPVEPTPPRMQTAYNFNAKISELRQGDIVQCQGMRGSPFSTAIVSKVIPDCEVTLWRPYGMFNPETGTTYVGIEDRIIYSTTSNVMLFVYRG